MSQTLQMQVDVNEAELRTMQQQLLSLTRTLLRHGLLTRSQLQDEELRVMAESDQQEAAERDQVRRALACNPVTETLLPPAEE